MAEELEVSRGGDSPGEALKAQVEAKIAATMEKATVELAEAPPPSD